VEVVSSAGSVAMLSSELGKDANGMMMLWKMAHLQMIFPARNLHLEWIFPPAMLNNQMVLEIYWLVVWNHGIL